MTTLRMIAVSLLASMFTACAFFVVSLLQPPLQPVLGTSYPLPDGSGVVTVVDGHFATSAVTGTNGQALKWSDGAAFGPSVPYCSGTSPDASDTLSYDAGAGCYSALPPNAWVQDLYCDITAQTPLSINSDTTFTFCGQTWAMVNSANTNAATTVDGTGLKWTPKQATNISNATLTAPYWHTSWTNYVPGLTYDTPVEIGWMQNDEGDAAANQDQLLVGSMIYNAGYNNQFTWQFGRGFAGGVNGWVVCTTTLQSNGVCTTTAINFTSLKVGDAVWPAGLLGGVATLTGATTIDSGVWPDKSAFQTIAQPEISATSSGLVASASSGQHPLADYHIYLAALRNGSTTTYTPHQSVLRIRHRPVN